MDIKQLTPDLAVSPQLIPNDMRALKEAGIRAVICNRPDGEDADQPTFDEIARAARAEGILSAYVPVTSGKVTDADAAAFYAAMSELPKPVLAYCRTGTRSATLWSLGNIAPP